MQLNLNDPDSIVRWWRGFPERHWHHLDVLESTQPEFWGAIRHARRLIEADPLFQRGLIDAFVAPLAEMPAWDVDEELAEEAWTH